jgi:nucleoid-associated protein YgaU
VETERRRLKAVADPAVAVRWAGQPPLRLTRRGRVVLQSVVIAAVVLTFAGVAATSKASPGVWATPGEQSVVVHTGDTLWSIASRHVPGGDRRAAVEAIRQLNGLRGTRIEVGQELVLPSR